MQNRYTIGYMQYFGIDQAPGWSYCTVTTPPQTFSRMNGTNSTPITGAVYSASTNPYQNMLNGFYSNGSHMIIVTSGNVQPNSGNIGFGTSVKNMAESHWIGAQDDAAPILTPISSTVFQPAVDNCKTLIIFPRQGSWVELNSFCLYATVTNNHGSIIIGAKDVNSCNIILQDFNGANTTITVGANVTTTTMLTHMWSCDCSGTCNTSILINISKCLVNFTAIGNTTVQYDQEISTNTPSAGANPMRQKASVWSILFWIIIACIAIFLIVAIVHCCLGCCSKSAKEKVIKENSGSPKTDAKSAPSYKSVPDKRTEE